MEIIASERRPRRSSRLRRLASVLAIAAVAASTVVATQPAAAADPWLTQPEAGYVRFTIPNAAVEEAVGPVSQLVVEGNFGPSANWAQLGLSRSGANWSATSVRSTPACTTTRSPATTRRSSRTPRTPPRSLPSRSGARSSFRAIPRRCSPMRPRRPVRSSPSRTTATSPARIARHSSGRRRATPTDGRPYPVLYLQHGGGQGSRDWTDVGRAEQILDNLSLSGELADMIVVMGDGNVSDFSSELFDNLMPAVETPTTCRTRRRTGLWPASPWAAVRRSTCCATTRASSRTSEPSVPGRFGDLSELPVQQINNHTTLFRLYVGNKTDIAYNDVFDSMQQFDVLGLDYEFDGVNPDAGHNWNAWQENLIDFAPRLFHRKGNRRPRLQRWPHGARGAIRPSGARHDADAVDHR